MIKWDPKEAKWLVQYNQGIKVQNLKIFLTISSVILLKLAEQV